MRRTARSRPSGGARLDYLVINGTDTGHPANAIGTEQLGVPYGTADQRIALSISIFHIGGGEEPPWLRNYGIHPGVEHISAIRTDDTKAVIDRLHHLRDEYSISYFPISPAAVEPITPRGCSACRNLTRIPSAVVTHRQ